MLPIIALQAVLLVPACACWKRRTGRRQLSSTTWDEDENSPLVKKDSARYSPPGKEDVAAATGCVNVVDTPARFDRCVGNRVYCRVCPCPSL